MREKNPTNLGGGERSLVTVVQLKEGEEEEDEGRRRGGRGR